MSTSPVQLDRQTIAAAPVSYFKAVDAKDVDAVLEHFDEQATLTVQTDHATFSGTSEIRDMFTGFFADWKSMVHDVTNLVVDPEAGTAATEQLVTLVGDQQVAMHNCNFFTLNGDGKFSRVIIWMDGSNPLK